MCSTGAPLCSQTLTLACVIGVHLPMPSALGVFNHASGNRSHWRRSQSEPRKRTQCRVPFGRELCYTLKNKGASKCSSSDAIKSHFWFHKEPFSQRFFKESSLPYLFIIWRTFFHHKKPFVKQKGSSDVKGSLWNHWDRKVLLWHRRSTFIFKSIVRQFHAIFIPRPKPNAAICT